MEHVACSYLQGTTCVSTCPLIKCKVTSVQRSLSIIQRNFAIRNQKPYALPTGLLANRNTKNIENVRLFHAVSYEMSELYEIKYKIDIYITYIDIFAP